MREDSLKWQERGCAPYCQGFLQGIGLVHRISLMLLSIFSGSNKLWFARTVREAKSQLCLCANREVANKQNEWYSY